MQSRQGKPQHSDKRRSKTACEKKLGAIRVAGFARESGMGSSLALSCNIRLFVIELDYGYRYLLEVCYELPDICFLIWLHYYSMLALHDHPVLEMVSLLFLELYQLLQYSYDCSSVMSAHPEGGGLHAGRLSIPY